MFGLTKGLRVLAEKRIVHRDLKLSNLLLSSKCKRPAIKFVKIADFELAKTVSDMIRTYCGTPPNMVPEILSK